MNEHSVKLSVYGILIDKDNRFLMQKRSNTSYANGWWSFPGGHVEPEEPILTALKRELFEELGVQTNPEHCSFQLTLIRKPNSGKRYVNFFYIVKDWSGIPCISDEKASELTFFSTQLLPDPTPPIHSRGIKIN